MRRCINQSLLLNETFQNYIKEHVGIDEIDCGNIINISPSQHYGFGTVDMIKMLMTDPGKGEMYITKKDRWAGFWYYDKESETIKLVTKDNEHVETPHAKYFLENKDWLVYKLIDIKGRK